MVILNKPNLKCYYGDSNVKYRTWVTGMDRVRLLDPSVLRMDAYVILSNGHHYLVIHYTRGAITRVATDAWAVTTDGLVPVWIVDDIEGTKQYWSTLNNSILRRIHATVVQLKADAVKLPNTSRVSLLAHYVKQDDAQPLDVANGYRPGNYRGRQKRVVQPQGVLPDLL
jgi:hypothetical protein